MDRAGLLLGDLRRTVDRLREALAQPESEYLRDACIQRFEFSFELAWKGIQAVARRYGLNCPSPRSALSMAFRNGWLSDEAAWLGMLETRNLTSHPHREPLAIDVHGALPGFAAALDALSRELDRRLAEATSLA
jgi:nucleotidyltransferase substrate binding protein (TIGR01987 family)